MLRPAPAHSRPPPAPRLLRASPLLGVPARPFSQQRQPVITEIEGESRARYFRGEGGRLVVDRDEKAKQPASVSVVSFARSCFLPEGYPGTVTGDYIRFYGWTWVQGVAGAASYVLATKALLVSVGAASPLPAVPAAAAISWVLKDGLGCLGMMFLASHLGRRFDSDTKRNKWRADVLHNAGVGLELATPLAPSLFLLFASLANVLKGLAGITSGATRASFNKNFALDENLGDVTAKAQTQGISAYLVGMGGGIALSFIPSNEPASLSIFACFGLLAAAHLYASYRALSCVQLPTLNSQRLSLLVDRHLRGAGGSPVDLSPASVAQEEAIILPPRFDPGGVVLGASVEDAVGGELRSVGELVGAFGGESYLVGWRDGRAFVVLRQGAGAADVLRGYFNAHCLRELLSGNTGTGRDDAQRRSLELTRQDFPGFLERLKGCGWNTEHVLLPVGGKRAEW